MNPDLISHTLLEKLISRQTLTIKYMREIQRPALGIAVLILNQQRVLIGQRLNEPMPASWQLPGGWVYQNESPQQAVQRKISQFPGMTCSGTHCVSHTDNRFQNGDHSLSLYFQCQCLNPEKVNLKQNGDCNNWRWVEWGQMPEDLFLPLKLLQASGFTPYVDKFTK